MRRELASRSAREHPEGHEFVVAAAAAGALVAALVLLGWLWVQLAALLSGHGLLGLGLLGAAKGWFALVSQGRWGDPAGAFAPAIARGLPGAPGMYVAAGAVLSAALVGLWALAVRLRAWGAQSPASFRRYSLAWWAWEHGWVRQRALGRPDDLARLFVRRAEPYRVILGTSGRRRRAVACEAEVHPMLCGSPRAGKTRYIARPALVEWWGPALATSTKLDLLPAAREREARGGALWVFDPFGDLDSCHYDPLHACGSWAVALRVAAAFAGQADVHGHDADGNARFFREQAQLLLAPLFFAAALHGGGMAQVLAWLDTRKWEHVDAALQGAAYAEAARAQLRAQTRGDSRTVANVIATASGLLVAYRHPEMHVRDDDGAGFVPNELLGDEGATLLIVASEQDQAILAPVICALITDVYREALARARREGGRLARPLLMLLDELANIAPIEHFPRWLAQAGDSGVLMLHIWQSLAQIAMRYGHDGRDAILGASNAQLFLAGQMDAMTQSHIAEGVPHEQVEMEMTGPRGRSVQVNHRPGLDRGQVRPMRPGTALLRYRNLPDTLLELRQGYGAPAVPARLRARRWGRWLGR